MKSAFKKAIALRLINQNPCDHVDLPKRNKREINVFSQEDARRFITALGTGSRALILELALTTGARPEEYLALRWPDVDFYRQSITFQRTIVWKKGGGWELDERMKTSHSRRTLKVPSTICSKLATLKRSQAEELLRLGPAYERNSFVFATETGTPINPRNLAQRDLKSALEKAKLGHHTLYSLRHSCATLLLAEGVNIKVIQERLGHADVSLTLSTYSHVLDGMQDEATKTIDELLYGLPKKAATK